jgi:hypothetical protein
MLQRIQTVYWFLSLACVGVLSSGVELVSFEKENHVFNLSFYSLTKKNAVGEVVESTLRFDFILVLALMLVTLISVFSFKNLKKQLNLSKWVMYFNLLLCIELIMFSYSGMIVSNPTSIHLKFWVSLLLVSFIFSVLAYLGVKKDKSLLDSVDRIR